MNVDKEYVDDGGRTTVPLMPSTVTIKLLFELSTAKLFPKLIVGADPYAMAGYVAAKTFVSLLERVEDFDNLTWEKFIELAESAPLKLPMAETS